MHTANEEKPLPQKLCSFTSSSCTCPASLAFIDCIFSTYGLLCFNIRNTLGADKAEKLIKIYRFYSWKKYPIEFTQSRWIILLFLPSSSNFVAVHFVSLKKWQLTVLVCCLFYVLLHSTFSKEKKDFWWVSLCFLVGCFKKTGVFFWLNFVQFHEPWRSFWTFNLFSEPNFKTVLFKRAWFSWFYDASLPFRFFVLIQSHICVYKMCFVPSFVNKLAIQANWS